MSSPNLAAEKTESMLHEVEQLFQSSPALHLWVIRFSITHGVVELALHEGNFPSGYRLMARGCDHISGPTQGGPYRLSIRRESDSALVIESSDLSFCLRCRHIVSLTPWREQTQHRALPDDVQNRIRQLERALENA